MHPRHRPSAVLAIVALIVFGAVQASAQARGDKPPRPSDNYDELYHRYLSEARATERGLVAGPPSFHWMSGLAFDPRARAVNDLLTIRIVENIEAIGSADSALSKNSSATASVTKLFGLETKFPDWLDPTNLANPRSDSQFKGSGATSRSSELTATMTARVVEVLPNGDLVLEGAREIDINGDRQIIVLTGVVRPNDIGRNNVVMSPAIGQLRIRYFGRGLIRDNLQPGWLVRVLNKVF